MKNKTIQNWLIVSIIVFIAICFTFFFFYREIENNIKISEQLQADLQKEISKREEIKDFNESFKLIENEKNLFETHFVQRSNVVPFLNKIEDMGKGVGTKAEVSSIEIANDNTGLIMQMKDVGTFSRVYKFITLLENSPYELEFNSINMYSGSTDLKTKESLWEASFTIKLVSFI